MEIVVKVYHSFEKPNGSTEEILVRIHNRQEELYKFITNQFHQLNTKIMEFAEDLDAVLSQIDAKLAQAATDSSNIAAAVQTLITSIGNSNLTPDQQNTLMTHANNILSAVGTLDTGLEAINTAPPATTPPPPVS